MSTIRKFSLFSFAATSAVALTACADMAGTSMTTGAGSASAAMAESEMPSDMRGFVAMAASSDMFEIQSSQLAKSRNVGSDVMAFADHMIRDHTMTSTEMKTMLSSMVPPMAPPTSMTDKHSVMLTKLQDAGTSDNFARAYIDAQLMAHKEAVALYSNYARNGDNPALQQFAQKTLPSLQGHLAHAQRLNAGGNS